MSTRLYDPPRTVTGRLTNAIRRREPEPVITELRRDLTFAKIADRAAKVIEADGYHLTDEQASVLTAIVTGRGRDV